MENCNKRTVNVDSVLKCPDHGTPVIVFSIKTVEGASLRYLFACPEKGCPRMLRVITKLVSEVTLLSIDGKEIV